MSGYSTFTYGVGVLIAMLNVGLGGYLMTHPSETTGITNVIIGLVLLVLIVWDVNRHAR